MTTEFMQVTLSQQPAEYAAGEKALLSTNGEGMTIHLRGRQAGRDPARGPQN